jgi:hypothetical protein
MTSESCLGALPWTGSEGKFNALQVARGMGSPRRSHFNTQSNHLRRLPAQSSVTQLAIRTHQQTQPFWLNRSVRLHHGRQWMTSTLIRFRLWVATWVATWVSIQTRFTITHASNRRLCANLMGTTAAPDTRVPHKRETILLVPAFYSSRLRCLRCRFLHPPHSLRARQMMEQSPSVFPALSFWFSVACFSAAGQEWGRVDAKRGRRRRRRRRRRRWRPRRPRRPRQNQIIIKSTVCFLGESMPRHTRACRWIAVAATTPHLRECESRVLASEGGGGSVTEVGQSATCSGFAFDF